MSRRGGGLLVASAPFPALASSGVAHDLCYLIPHVFSLHCVLFLQCCKNSSCSIIALFYLCYKEHVWMYRITFLESKDPIRSLNTAEMGS